ncbi:Uu.00g119360.m01.CDS01 [Anthostomella pinea]|uniref:Uu.00g119360.m01.CDS01 n=1 Tax=Anthostomella pinea TaxID=933095 RepID=A0AAI8VGM7_9PEZI|nr:Uu.00g119360.m01.CDS01 [Anthostomella pinea]
MADQIQEFFDVQRDFIKDGAQFMTRCTKPDQREYLKICQAVGVGFIVMGAVGYIVKLVHIPVNNVLVGGA